MKAISLISRSITIFFAFEGVLYLQTLDEQDAVGEEHTTAADVELQMRSTGQLTAISFDNFSGGLVAE